MATRRRGKLLAGIGALLALGPAGAGCISLAEGMVRQAAPQLPQFRAVAPDPRPAPIPVSLSSPAVVIAPRTELQWLVAADQIQPNHVMAGKNPVGPDGAV